MIRLCSRLFLACLLFGQNLYADVTVAAAASLTDALTELAQQYQQKTGVVIKTSFASSSALAKQIENGFPANVFISADNQWLDYLYDKGKIDGQSRRLLLANELVLIAPKGRGFKVQFEPNQSLAYAFEGKLCTGETETVPVGKYAKQALEKLTWWAELKSRIVGTEDVRSALAFVERGECSAGIVYASDAFHNDKVEVLGVFPSDSHSPIVYPIGLVTQSNEAEAFLQYLTEPSTWAVFAKYGFKKP